MARATPSSASHPAPSPLRIPTARRFFLAGAALAVLVTLLVALGIESHGLTLGWIVSVGLFLEGARRSPKATAPRRVSAAALLIIALFPVAVRVLQMSPERVHGDEVQPAYFAATYDFLHTTFFDFMPARADMSAQFPKPYFALQRIVFAGLGAGRLQLRLSTQIYVAVASLFLFLVVRELCDEASAWVAVALNAFFAPALYLETWASMITSSTAIFLVFFLYLIRYARNGSARDAAGAGVACGFCYLAYYSSYLALPILLSVAAIRWARHGDRKAVAVALAGAFVALAPFAAWSARFGLYPLRRLEQIDLLTGKWSPYRPEVLAGASRARLIAKNLVLSVRAVAVDGLGGNRGYDFGRLALLDGFSLILLFAGTILAIAALRRRPEMLLVFLVIVSAFVLGVVMTVPPPAFHRFAIAYPFLIILMTLPLSRLLRSAILSAGVRTALAAALVVLFVCLNERRFVEALTRDGQPTEWGIVQLLNSRYRDRAVLVAAKPNFAFAKWYYFLGPGNPRVRTDYPSRMVKTLSPSHPYVYVVPNFERYREAFERADPRGRFMRFPDSYGVFAN